MKNFSAISLPAGTSDISKEFAFETEDEAWEYIKTKICSRCLKDLENGGFENGTEKEPDFWEINHVAQTACGAEWLVIDEREMENKERTLSNLFDAAGFIKVEKENSNEN